LRELKLIVGFELNYIKISLKTGVNDSMLKSVLDLLQTISDTSVSGEIVETREIAESE